MESMDIDRPIQSITFKVDKSVKANKIKSKRQLDYSSLIQSNNQSVLKKNNIRNPKVYSSVKQDSLIISDVEYLNSFIFSAVTAYSNHHKLVIRPDDIWMAILNMFTIYINNNSAILRSKFVNFQEKKKLVVYNKSEGSILDASFEQLIRDMKEEIKKNIADPSITDWLVPSFTTTTDSDKVVYSAALMSTLKSYFEYEFESECGLPEVTLLGSVQDWLDIKSRFNRVKDYDCGTNQMNQWCELLNPVLDKLIETAQGNPDIKFWNSIAYRNEESGGDIITGWITAFNIFDIDHKYIGDQKEESNDGKTWLEINYDTINVGYTSVYVLLNDNGVYFDSELYCGHITVDILDRSTIKPNLDYCLLIDTQRKIQFNNNNNNINNNNNNNNSTLV